MQDSQVTKLHQNISKAIDSSRLYDAFSYLLNNSSGLTALSFERDNIRKLEDNYKYMLHYMSEGFEDNQKDRFIADIKENLYRFNDLLLSEKISTLSQLDYFAACRLMSVKKMSIGQLIGKIKEYFLTNPEITDTGISEVKKIDNDFLYLLSDLFNRVWTLFGKDKTEYEALESFLLEPEDVSPDSSFNLKEIKDFLISAIFLSNLQFFDYQSFSILLNVYESATEPDIISNSVISIVILTLIHSKRIQNLPDIAERFKFWSIDDNKLNDLQDTLFNLIKAYDTKRVTTKMTREVMPELMKIRPDIISKFKNSDISPESFMSDMNPEWEEIFENSGIGDKLRELNDMQMEGSDVMMTAFSNLKSFPFFNQLSNWFLPLMINHPEFQDAIPFSDEKTVSRLRKMMCDNDLYSFFLSFKTMPENQRLMAVSNLEMQMKEAEEALASVWDDSRKAKVSLSIRYRFQNLYRFFKLYRKHNDFIDPFSKPIGRDEIETISALLGRNPSGVEVMAEFYFKHEYFKEAAELFEFIVDSGNSDFRLWEKIGFSYGRQNLHSKALEWYRKAEIIEPDSEWLTKKIAASLRYEGLYNEAIVYYKKALEKDPDNFHLLMGLANCYSETGEYSKALEKYYHADYIKPNNRNSSRAIAWCEFLNGNFRKSEEKYKFLLESETAEPEDYLNAGHSSLVSGNIKEAIRHYLTYNSLAKINGLNSIDRALVEDYKYLKKFGIKPEFLRLVIDKIKYS